MKPLQPKNWILGGQYEESFPLSFRVVNSALFSVLDRWALTHAQATVPREETAGATRYILTLTDGPVNDGSAEVLTVVIYVLERGTETTSVRIHAMLPRSRVLQPGYEPTQEELHPVRLLLGNLSLELIRTVRFTYPEYTHKVIEITPPMPSWSEKDGPERLFRWREAYAVNMTDKELAKLAGVAYSTLRNTFSDLGLTKEKTPRGRAKKG